MTLPHLDALEADAIHIIREVAAGFRAPVMLYSIGKDSSVLLHLLRKAFAPAPPPMPLLHVDTTWKFRQMYALRERVAAAPDITLLVHINQEGVGQGISPLVHGATIHTQVMKTVALRQALDKHGFDAAIGGARRDEDISRAKERVFSFRNAQHRWDAKAQRPELAHLYNTGLAPGETARIFPLSDWTELDIWRYIKREGIEVVPLYFAAEREVIQRDGTWLLVDDERLVPQPGEQMQRRCVRFRTLGCYPLTGAIESGATTLDDVIDELTDARTSERQGRVIDRDPGASMERKKQEGYF
jgi:sulfate adenylyltransferase subunit 2